ncbi:TPA: hypothetical protein ACIECM_002571 [Enterococcus faecium]
MTEELSYCDLTEGTKLLNLKTEKFLRYMLKKKALPAINGMTYREEGKKIFKKKDILALQEQYPALYQKYWYKDNGYLSLRQAINYSKVSKSLFLSVAKNKETILKKVDGHIFISEVDLKNLQPALDNRKYRSNLLGVSAKYRILDKIIDSHGKEYRIINVITTDSEKRYELLEKSGTTMMLEEDEISQYENTTVSAVRSRLGSRLFAELKFPVSDLSMKNVDEFIDELWRHIDRSNIKINRVNDFLSVEIRSGASMVIEDPKKYQTILKIARLFLESGTIETKDHGKVLFRSSKRTISVALSEEEHKRLEEKAKGMKKSTNQLLEEWVIQEINK